MLSSGAAVPSWRVGAVVRLWGALHWCGVGAWCSDASGLRSLPAVADTVGPARDVVGSVAELQL